jgi:hypothetical protein
MPLSDNQLHYFASYAVAFVAFGLIGRWYLWPALKDRVPRTALTPLPLYACFRVNGLMFLMPGLVSAQQPKAFAIPTAYGDLTAAVLALIALWPVRLEKTAAIPLVWLFNIAGLLDLVYANISTFKDHVDPTYLGVSYYQAAINVPAMVVVHVLIFAYLFRHSRDLPMNTNKIKENRFGYEPRRP